MAFGTTGTPKGARRSVHGASAGATVGMLGQIPCRSADVFVIPAPLFHAWGFANLTLAFALGATMVAIDRFTPEGVVDAVAEHDVTVLVAAPMMLKRMLIEPDLDRDPLRRLRITGSSGSALSAALATEGMDRAGDNLYNLCGSTEVGSATIATPGALRREPPGRWPRVTSAIPIPKVASSFRVASRT
jgi:fatty-acyl-CoA synthase